MGLVWETENLKELMSQTLGRWEKKCYHANEIRGSEKRGSCGDRIELFRDQLLILGNHLQNQVWGSIALVSLTRWREAETMRPPPAPFWEVWKWKNMPAWGLIYKQCNWEGRGHTHHPKNLEHRHCWNPRWWFKSLPLFSYLSFFLYSSHKKFNSMMPRAVQKY